MSARKLAVIVGLGETGWPLYEIFKARFGDEIHGFDPKKKGYQFFPMQACDQLHVCIPWGPDFFSQVKNYQERTCARVTVIHSTVPVGTTAKIAKAVHSPILGRHRSMRRDIESFTKWIGGPKAMTKQVIETFLKAGLGVRPVNSSKATEALKLMCLAKYGVSLAFARYQDQVCKKLGLAPGIVQEWDQLYNQNVLPHLRRPVLRMDGQKIGGHCVVPGTKLLQKQFANQMLKEVLRHGNDRA